MVTGTFYGSNVRIDSHVENGPPVYVVRAKADGVWEVIAQYSEKEDYLARYEAIKLAERMAKKLI